MNRFHKNARIAKSIFVKYLVYWIAYGLILTIATHILFFGDSAKDVQSPLKDMAMFYITAAVGLAAIIGTFATYYLVHMKDTIHTASGDLYEIVPKMHKIRGQLKGILIAFMVYILMILGLLLCAVSKDWIEYGRYVALACTLCFCFLTDRFLNIIGEIFEL